MKRKLSDSKLKAAKPKPDGKPNHLTDGGGLFLQVKTTGKYWRYNYQYAGKRKTLALGSYPEISLEQARKQHEEARSLLARDIDPSSHKRTLKALAVETFSNQFEAIALEWFTFKKADWSDSHTVRTLSCLQKDVFPLIGKLPIDQIKPIQIIDIMRRIEKRGAGELARRVKYTLGNIFKYAITLERAERNPAGDIDNTLILKPRVSKSFATITNPKEIGELLKDIDIYQGTFVVKCALQLSPLVMLRPVEIRMAEWTEIDFETSTWTIPIKRMKAPTHVKRANLSVHIVPLSHQALTIFRELYPLTGRFKYVFPSVRGVSRCLSDNAVRTALRTMGYRNEDMTPHGFRAMASTILNQMHTAQGVRRWDKDAIERQLSHKEPNAVRAAYDRSDHLEARREMLQVWADYLDGLKQGGKIIPLKRL